jgi:hypothetical protein
MKPRIKLRDGQWAAFVTRDMNPQIRKLAINFAIRRNESEGRCPRLPFF